MEAHQLLIARQGQRRTSACLAPWPRHRPRRDRAAAAVAGGGRGRPRDRGLDSPGPVVFRQRRLGRDLSPFTVLKFRTMHANARLGAAPRLRAHADRQPGRGRRPGRAVQARRRRPRHRRRPRPAQVEPGRAAPAVERHPRRDVARRAAARHPLRGRALPRPLPASLRRQAGPHRALAGQRPQRADLRGDGPARRRVRRAQQHRPRPARSSPRRCGSFCTRKGAA